MRKGHIREIAWIAAGQTAVLIGGIASVKILTSLLLPDQYGILALGLTMVAISQQLWAGPLTAATGRNVSPYQRTGRLDVLIVTSSSIYLRFAIMQTIILTLGIMASSAFFDLNEEFRNVLILGIFLAVIQPAFTIAQQVFLQLRRRPTVAIFEGLYALLKPAGAAALVVACGVKSAWAMLGILIAAIILASGRGLQLMQLARGGAPSKELDKELVRFAVPYMSWGALSWCVTAGDRWILAAVTNPETVGLFVVGIQVGTIIPRLSGQLINSFFVPILNDMAGLGTEKGKVRRALAINTTMSLGVLLFGVIGAFGLSVFGEPILDLLAGQKYQGAVFALPWIFAGGAIYEAAYILFGIGPILYRPQVFVKPRTAAYSLTILLMIFLAMRWDLNGMVAAYFAGAVIQFCAVAYTAIRLFREFGRSD